MSALPIVRTIVDLRAHTARWRANGARIGFVPTMGALHAGHIALVTQARRTCDAVIASVFVNPTQFAAHEDLSRYPRDEAGDAAKLAAGGCDLLFAPTPGEMYPQHFSTSVTVGGVSADLEGEFRPQMFSGVALVVSKLLLQTMPDIAIFGEKDFQQLMVVRRVVRDLDIPVTIIAGPTVREEDGLAMSSRNAYLSAQERAIAPALHTALQAAAAAIRAGDDVEQTLDRARDAILSAGFAAVDYVAARDAEEFTPIVMLHPARSARLLAAARLGATRLIDNIAL
jgi:pantoate--beta-alanine ligase